MTSVVNVYSSINSWLVRGVESKNCLHAQLQSVLDVFCILYVELHILNFGIRFKLCIRFVFLSPFGFGKCSLYSAETFQFSEPSVLWHEMKILRLNKNLSTLYRLSGCFFNDHFFQKASFLMQHFLCFTWSVFKSCTFCCYGSITNISIEVTGFCAYKTVGCRNLGKA
jgi:hypothetical protein